MSKKTITGINKDSYFKHLQTYLDVTDIQFYNPILEHFIKNETDLHNSTLKSKYLVESITKDLNTSVKKSKTPYLKHFYTSRILNTYTKKTFTKDIFIKISPIINVIDYILNKSYLDKPHFLPNFYVDLVIEQANNFNNPCYIDSMFSLLSSKLSESGKCPTFPFFYGTLSCLKKKYKYDITEDYSQVQYSNQFQENINKVFTIDEIEIDDDSISSNSSTIERKNEIENTLLELDSLEDLKISYITHKINTKPCDKNNNLDNFIKTLTKNDSFSDIIENNDTFKYCNLTNYPVQLLFTEKLEQTLDDLIDSGYIISQTEWKSILFQICFGLAVAQKHYNFVHNDLHSANIMFTKTNEKYLYFEYESNIYKVPTFGKITKIIDFGRATFNYEGILFFSSVFDKNGDAEGQYDYPTGNDLDDCKIKPNMSFDLARLSTTIIEHHKPNTPVFKLLKKWITDKNGYCLINEEDDFDLYITIAKYVKNAVPKKQLTQPLFKGFLQKNKKLDKKLFVYKY